MGPIAKSKVTLRISGDDFTEESMNLILQTKATSFQTRNLPRNGIDENQHCQWRLSAPENLSLEEQIVWLLANVTDDLESWNLISNKYSSDVFCGLFLSENNEGFELDPAVMKSLAIRQLLIGFDIYGK
jgi:hypothetical protein